MGKKTRERLFNLRLSDDEIKQLHKIAEFHHLSASAYVRQKIYEDGEMR